MVDGVSTLPLAGQSLVWNHALGSHAEPPVSCPNFFTGPENRLAATAFDPLIRGDRAWHPLVLCGPSGVGKTHLARGFAALRKKNDPAAILCQTADELIADYTSHMAAGELAEFRDSFRSIELWVLEDLERLAGKTKTQHEIVRLLDELTDREGLLVATCRGGPHTLRGLIPSLRGRLTSGLTVPLSPPSSATREALVEHLAAERGMDLADEVVQRLAAGISGTARELAGALLLLEAATRLEGRDIALEDVEAFLDSQPQRVPTLAEITQVVAQHFALKTNVLKGASRRQTVARARSLAMYLARELTGKSLKQIGRWFGSRDHTTVLHSVRKIAQLLSEDELLNRTTHQLRTRLAGA